MRSFSFADVRGDLFGGLTAGVIALPLALAFGVASGAGAAAGLYGAIVLGLFAAVLGGTPSQISGPTGPMTVVMAAAIVAFGGNVSIAMAAVVLAGVFQVGFGLAGLGRLVRFIPYPVLSGFMSGIGVIIILLQLPVLFGAPAIGSPLGALAGLPHALASLDPATLGLGLASMAIVFLTPARFSRLVPSPLVALVGLTLAACLLGIDTPSIGAIPSGIPALTLPSLGMDQVGRVVGLGLTLAALGSIDTLLTSIVADSLTKTRHDSRRELVGQGVGNALAGLFGGLPGAGATMRTVVNVKSGGSTRLSGVIHALFLISVLLGLGPLAARIPLAVLAGILVKVGVDILDWRLIGLARRAPRTDLAVMLSVFGITVFADLIIAVAAGVTLSSFLVTYRIARQTQVRIFEPGNGGEIRAAERGIQDDTDFGIRVISVRGPFFFGTAAQMQDKIVEFVGAKVAVINCLEAPFMDLSAIFALVGMVEKLKDQGLAVVAVVQESMREQFLSLGMDKLIGPERTFTDHEVALDAAREILAHQAED